MKEYIEQLLSQAKKDKEWFWSELDKKPKHQDYIDFLSEMYNQRARTVELLEDILIHNSEDTEDE